MEGLDGWKPEWLSVMNQEAASILEEIYNDFMALQTWPSVLLTVRTQVLPKPTKEQIPTAKDWRPISISSAWVRLWSKWQLLKVTPMLSKIDQSMVGGIPGRDPNLSLLKILQEIDDTEERLLRGEHVEMHMIAIDAIKCFDKVKQHHALQRGEAFGLPPELLSGVGTFFKQHVRRFSANGFLDRVCWQPTRGLLQGDALSVLLCTLCVEEWMHASICGGENISVCGYIDDRTLVAREVNEIQSAWERSLCWEKEAGWEANPKKDGLSSAGRAEGQASLWQSHPPGGHPFPSSWPRRHDQEGVGQKAGGEG